jgi:hypothetical protein
LGLLLPLVSRVEKPNEARDKPSPSDDVPELKKQLLADDEAQYA